MRELIIKKQIPEDLDECKSILCKNCANQPKDQTIDHCCDVKFRWWKARKESEKQLYRLIKFTGFDKKEIE